MTPTAASLTPGLCGCCGGARAVVERGEPRTCSVCGGDGLARRAHAAIADDARLSVDWLT